MARIRRNDEVVVIAGKDKGERGKVLLVDPDKGRIKVEGVNLVKKHSKPTQKRQSGGIIEQEGTIHISNVMLWDKSAQARSRCGVQTVQGRRVRVLKKSGETLG